MESRPRYSYIGITGLPGSGKNTCARHLQEKLGYVVIDLGEVVAEEVKSRGLPVTRENLQETAIDLRRKQGLEVITRKAVEGWIPWVEGYVEQAVARELEESKVGESKLRGSKLHYVFNGIRNIEETDFLRSKFDHEFCLIGIVASSRIRYERAKKRAREGIDTDRYDEFLKVDRRELDLFGVGNTLMIADFIVLNEGSMEQVLDSVDRIVHGMRVGAWQDNHSMWV